MKAIKITERQIKMGFFTMLAPVLAPIIASFVAEITLHFATKTPAIKGATAPPPPVVHQTIINHYYAPGGPPIDVPEIPATKTTERLKTNSGGIPRRDYLEAVRISRMIEERMEDAADNEDQRRQLESSLDRFITSPDKDTPLEQMLGKKLTFADLEHHTEEEEKVARSLQALMEGPLSKADRTGRSVRKIRAVPAPGRHPPMTRAVMRRLCPHLRQMLYDGATYRARTLDMTIQKLAWVGLCMGFSQGGPVWHIMKVQHDVTRDRLMRSIVMNTMGLSILAFGTRGSNQTGIPADPNLIELDKRDPRAGILTLAMYPTLNQRQLGVVQAEQALLGEGLIFEFTPPEWAENPFGERDHDPFGLAESSSDSDNSFLDAPEDRRPAPAAPLPEIEDEVLEEVLGEDVPDRVGEAFVPFDQVADFDYIDLAAEEDAEQQAPAPAKGDEFEEWQDAPQKRKKRGLKGPVFRPRPKPRPRPRPGQGPRKGTGIGRPIIRPTKQNIAQVLKTQGVDKIKVVDKLPAGAQKINIRYKGSDTSQTSYRGSQTLQTSLDSTLNGPALNNPTRSFAQVQNNQNNIFPLVPLASSAPLKIFGISSQPDLRQIQKLGSRDLTFASPRSSQSSLASVPLQASTYKNPNAKGASALAPHKGKALKKEVRRAEKAQKDLDTSVASSSRNSQPLKETRKWPIRRPPGKAGGGYSKLNHQTGMRARLRKIMKTRTYLRARAGRSPLASAHHTRVERAAMQEALTANRATFFRPGQPWNRGFKPDYSPASHSFISQAATGMTNFFTYGGRGRYLGKWSMNFLSSFGTMALAGIVQSAYTNSVWGPRAEAATQALVENVNTLPWTIVRDRSTNETYIVPGNGSSSAENGELGTTTAKPNYFGLDRNQTHQQFRRSLDMLESLPSSSEFEHTIKQWVDEHDLEERKKQIEAGRREKPPGWLSRIEKPTAEDFVAMSNYLPFGRQLLENPIKVVERMEKATVDLFEGKERVERYRRINAAIRNAMGKLKDERDRAMEERYGTRDVLRATQRFAQMEVSKETQPGSQKSEEQEVLKSLIGI